MVGDEDSKNDKELEWDITPGFRDDWKKAKSKNGNIAEAMAEFDRCKRASPPLELPRKMRDHKLDGPLKGSHDCHLDGDVILIYKPLKRGVYRLIAVCDHGDLRGPKARILAAKLKK
jgi:addiction module RelE/StbE family toxin